MSKIKNISLENLAVFNREMKKKYAAKSDVPTVLPPRPPGSCPWW